MKIAIVDYGMGNLRSVAKAFERVGVKPVVTDNRGLIAGADRLVLPGVGAFADAMLNMKTMGLIDAVRSHIVSGKPFLGLCLGLQLLFEASEEAPGVRGLGIFRGTVKKFTGRSLKIPHMGWNIVTVRKRSSGAALFRGVPDGAYFYFVHSYYVRPREESLGSATTWYGRQFVSAVCRENVVAFQFHPEKSQAVGLKLLRNFLRWKGVA